MLCTFRSHKEDLAGILALRETIDFLGREVEKLLGQVQSRNQQLALLRDHIEYLKNQVSEERAERQQIFGIQTATGPLPTHAPLPADIDTTPIAGASPNISDYVRNATIAETRSYADDLRALAKVATREDKDV